MSQQGLLQQSIRDATGTTGTYEGDWHALFDLDGINAGPFNERLLAWINLTLGVTYTDINDAMAAYAADQGAYNFSSIGALTTLTGERITEDGAQRITEAGDIRITE